MEKNSGSDSSFCRRIHQTVSPAFRAFRRIPSHQSASVTTDSYYPNHAAETTATNIQNKQHLPQKSKNHHKKGAGIPVHFDYSVPTSEGHAVGQKDYGEQQGKKPKLDKSDTFGEYIQRAKVKIRTLTNVGGGHSNPTTDEAGGGGSKEKEHHQKDHFGEFIQLAKKKIRTTTNIGKTNSIKRG